MGSTVEKFCDAGQLQLPNNKLSQLKPHEQCRVEEYPEVGGNTPTVVRQLVPDHQLSAVDMQPVTTSVQL